VSPSSPTPIVTSTAGTCAVSNAEPVISAVIPTAAAGPVGAVIDVVETQQVSATQSTRVEIHVAGPLTAGETVSVTGGGNPLMTSCEVASVVSAVGGASLLLPRPEASQRRFAHRRECCRRLSPGCFVYADI
jgi:hypothetical protein